VRTVPDVAKLDEVFGEMTKGGKPVPKSTYPGPFIELPDGTTVGKRPGSKSGGPTIDMTFPDGTERGIHVFPWPPVTK
jgi:hypothetical protein